MNEEKDCEFDIIQLTDLPRNCKCGEILSKEENVNGACWKCYCSDVE